jgi:hypothetical protein
MKVRDVAIALAKFDHSEYNVYLQFRESPTPDVVQQILVIGAQYGCNLTDLRSEDEAKRILEGSSEFRINCVSNFRINCVGGIACEVGDALAEALEKKHNLICTKLQNLYYRYNCIRLYQVVNFHKNPVVEISDIQVK